MAAAFLAAVLTLGIAGCGGGGAADLAPAFEQAGIADKSYVQNRAIDSETLPAASGGDGALTYAITPQLPAGLTFDPATRRLAGTPAIALPATLYTYSATDSDATGPDSAALSFTITVAADLVPVFEQAGIADKSYVQNRAIGSETLPAASGGDGALTYAITPQLPAGITFDAATRRLSGAPAAPQPPVLYTYIATDSDATGLDSAALSFTITVAQDLVPAFEQAGIADKSYVQNRAIDSETLPAAGGGDGTLTYAITPQLPAGITFDAATRRLSGTPAVPQPATLYTYSATDSDTTGADSVSLPFTITVEALASVTISTAAADVDEGDDRTPVAVTLTLSHAVTDDVTVTLASTGSARLGSDFDLTGTVVTVAGGSTQAATMLTPIRDLEAEGDETVSLEIASVAGRGEIGARRRSTSTSATSARRRRTTTQYWIRSCGYRAGDVRHRRGRPLPDLSRREHRPRCRIAHRGHPADHDGPVFRCGPVAAARHPSGARPGTERFAVLRHHPGSPSTTWLPAATTTWRSWCGRSPKRTRTWSTPTRAAPLTTPPSS